LDAGFCIYDYSRDERDIRYSMLDAGCQMPDARYRMPDAGCRSAAEIPLLRDQMPDDKA
jgi:hypothetical protein